MRVTSTPVLLDTGTSPANKRLYNDGPNTVYYKADSSVSATSNDGSVASGASLAVTSLKWLAAAAGAPTDVRLVDLGSSSGSGTGLPSGGSVGDTIINTAPGTGGWTTPTAVTAADISYTPVGSISSTTVQAAVAEVASEASGGGGKPDASLPTGAKVHNLPNRGHDTTAAVTSGTLRVVGGSGAWIASGTVISSITFVSVAAAVSPTNQWFALIDRDTLDVLATTVDDTTTAWGTNTAKTLLLATTIGGATPGGTYTAPADKYLYFGVVQVASTPATLQAARQVTAGAQIAPKLTCNGQAGLTVPSGLTTPLTALSTSAGAIAYAFAS